MAEPSEPVNGYNDGTAFAYFSLFKNRKTDISMEKTDNLDYGKVFHLLSFKSNKTVNIDE